MRRSSLTKREQICEAALHLFVQRGYYSVSIPDIVRESKVSTGTIYNYFNSKEELARSLYEKTVTDFSHDFEEKLTDCESTRQKLDAFVALIFTWTEETPETMEYMLYMKHGEFLSDAKPTCMTEPFRQVRQIVSEGMSSGDLREADPYIAAISYTGVVLRAAETRLSGIISVHLSGVQDEFAENAWRTIAA